MRFQDVGRVLKFLGWNLLWYIPLSLGIIFWILIPNVVMDYGLIRLLIHRWTWVVLISPSTGVFLGALIGTVLLPMQMLFFIPIVFDENSESYRHRYITAFGIFAVSLFFVILCGVLLWGSMPVEADVQHVINLRLVPFFPWPDRPWGEF